MCIDKELLINAVIGCGFKSMEYINKMTELGLARFGDQWNPEDWVWVRGELEKLSMDRLKEIYNDRYQ